MAPRLILARCRDEGLRLCGVQLSPEKVSYFAYGSNMSEATMASMAPTAWKIGTARLPNHRLAFTRKSTRWRAGVADALPCAGFSVFGIVYSIDADDLAKLDKKEGVPHAYERADVTVLLNHEPIMATTYRVVEPEAPEIPPKTDYLVQIIQAARGNSFPESYLSFLEYVRAQFSAGTRDEGLLLGATTDRRKSKGVPLIRLNPQSNASLSNARNAALDLGGRRALAKVEFATTVPPGTCQADQSLRTAVGAAGQFCFGHRALVLPCGGGSLAGLPIQPRALVLSLRAQSYLDSEKNYCVIHPDHIRVLGMKEGDFVRLFIAPQRDTGIDTTGIAAVSMRVFSGSAAAVTKLSGKSPYPERGKVYIDADGRSRLGIPDADWLGTPLLIRPALWKALASRVIYYGLTALLGIGAFLELLQAFEPHLPLIIDAILSLVASGVVTVAVSITDLRSRFRY
jgi:cation transport regulator ChaC